MHCKVIEGVPVEYTLHMLRKDNPNISFPRTIPEDTLASFGVYRVSLSAKPTIDETVEAINGYEITGTIEDGFTQSWVVRNLTPEEAEELDQQSKDDEDDAAVKQGARVRALLTARPAQIETYIDNNVTNLASAKELLKDLSKAVSILARRSLRD